MNFISQGHLESFSVLLLYPLSDLGETLHSQARIGKFQVYVQICVQFYVSIPRGGLAWSVSVAFLCQYQGAQW